jgi:tetratricopeptide (TPR) repeat protein
MRQAPTASAIDRDAAGWPGAWGSPPGGSDEAPRRERPPIPTREVPRRRVASLGMGLLALVITGGMLTTAALVTAGDLPGGESQDDRGGGTRYAEATGTSSVAMEFYRRGMLLLADPLAPPGARSDAVWMFEKAVQLDSTFAKAWAALSEWYSSAPVGSRALALAIHRPPTGPAAGRITAKSALRAAIRYGPRLPETLRARGWFAFDVQRNREQALHFFEAARRLRPDDPDVVSGIGLVRVSQGRWEEGVGSLERALQLDPGSQWRAALLGQMYAHLRQYAEAEQLYDRALRVAPTYTEAYIGKAIVRLKRDGDVRGARQVLEEAGRNVDRGELLFTFVQVMARHPFVRILNDYFQTQLADRRVANHLRERCLGCYWQLSAELAERRGDRDMALAIYDSAVQQLTAPKPNRITALSMAAMGERSEALQWVEHTVSAAPLAQEAISGYHVLETVVEVQMRAGDFDGALGTLRQLLSHPGLLSTAVLELDPLWDPLRGRPEFRAMLSRFSR